MAGCRMNYQEECELAVNKMINSELYMSYTYLSMAYYFERDGVALKGCSDWCFRHSDEEREHAKELASFQVERGGKVQLNDIPKPEKDDWGSPLEAMEHAMACEKKHNEKMIALHALAHKHHDGHMSNFIEDKFLAEEVEELKEISDIITNLKRVGTGLGEYIFDKETMAKTD